MIKITAEIRKAVMIEVTEPSNGYYVTNKDNCNARTEKVLELMQEHTKQNIEALREELHKDFAPFVGEIIDKTINRFLENIK